MAALDVLRAALADIQTATPAIEGAIPLVAAGELSALVPELEAAAAAIGALAKVGQTLIDKHQFDAQAAISSGEAALDVIEEDALRGKP